ncbi:MAG: hypothetical protein HQM08_11470 [Candidatus Riflebacteria bacterium]|nr:hypothetical protein [Candidatus Riflebacteria bacterium]
MIRELFKTGMPRVSVLIFLMVFSTVMARGETSLFQVAISIATDSLNTDSYKTNSQFYVNTNVKNISSIDQKIVVWTARGWSWLSNNQEVGPCIAALQNVPTEKTLHPGEEYSDQIQLTLVSKKKKSVVFRLGFYPKAEDPVSGMTIDMTKNVFWSNEVTLER